MDEDPNSSPTFWAIVIVAVPLALIALPSVGEYLAVVVLAFSAMILTSLNPLQASSPLIQHIAHATGANPTYVGPGMVFILLAVAGLYCLVRASFSRSPSDYGAAATALLGFLAVTALAYVRMSDKWPHV